MGQGMERVKRGGQADRYEKKKKRFGGGGREEDPGVLAPSSFRFWRKA